MACFFLDVFALAVEQSVDSQNLVKNKLKQTHLMMSGLLVIVKCTHLQDLD